MQLFFNCTIKITATQFLHFCLIVHIYSLYCILLSTCLSCIVLFGLMTTRLNKHYYYSCIKHHITSSGVCGLSASIISLCAADLWTDESLSTSSSESPVLYNSQNQYQSFITVE